MKKFELKWKLYNYISILIIYFIIWLYCMKTSYFSVINNT